MTVAELIEHLKTLPQDLPVAAYNGAEDFDWLSDAGIEIASAKKDRYYLSQPGSSTISPPYELYEGDFVRIIGL